MPEKGPPSTPFFPALRRLLKLSGKYQAWFYLALALDLALAILIIVQNAILRNLFDAVIAGVRQDATTYAVVSVVIGLVNVPLSYFFTLSQGLFSECTLYQIRQKLAAHFNQLPVSYLEERHSGDFLSVVNADLAKVKSLTGNDLLSLVGQVNRGLLSLIYIIFISWQLTLVTLVFTPILFFVLSKLSAPIIKRTEQMQNEIGNLNSIAQDGMSGLAITKSFNLVKIIEERFKIVNRDVVHQGLRIARLSSGVDILSGVLGFTPFLIAFGFGGYLAITGQITFGSIFAFINLLNFVVNPLSSIPRLVGTISQSVGAAQRIFTILDHDLERSKGTVIEPARQAGEIIRFQDASFAYDTGVHPAESPATASHVLHGVSFDIQPGEKVAIVGPSGSGKSTLVKLLMGFYPLSDGQIYLFGQNLDEWQLPVARQHMAFVAQDTYLFPVSIKDNIACGRLDASQAEIEQAAQAANIHDYILTLPKGYDTLVGERGARLSGGQKQRISLARAILKNAPILLLDEPTSALDTESESMVQEALDRFMADRTSIVIAHRLSTIKEASRVLVLEAGRLVEQGTHEELLKRGGLYQALYEKQFDWVQGAEAG